MLERPVKTRDDYRVAKFIVEDTRYEQDYDTFLAECARVGNAGKVIALNNGGTIQVDGENSLR